jgi:cytoskeletal protein CcmA (bactofilin family)
MWNGGSKRHKTEKLNTLVGSEAEIRGDLTFTGGLHVDGNIKGNVRASGEGGASLVLSEQGSIEGDIRVPHVVVNGLVVGDIYATETIELAAMARITGDVYYNRLEVAMGAEVNGNLIHLAESAPANEPVPEASRPAGTSEQS